MTEWSSTVEVGREYGQTSGGTSVTVGGEIGKERCAE